MKEKDLTKCVARTIREMTYAERYAHLVKP